MDLGIQGRVAVITGASRGLGREAALALAVEGCKVAICARGEEKLRQTVEELETQGTEAIGVVADVTQESDLEHFYSQTVAAFGKVDIIVNNAGGGAGAPNLTEVNIDDLKLAFERNLWPALRLTKLVLPGMRERRWGRIINISSIYGREYGGGIGYMMAKAAMIAMTKHLGIQLAGENVLANSIAPGSISHAGGNWERFQQNQPPEVVQEFIRRNLPVGRFGWPEPVGAMVAFLASERADLVTATAITVDGGQSRSLI